MKIIEMNREQAQNYLNELNGFYRKGKPKVSDEEFDVLLDEYKSKFQDDDFIDKLLLGEKGKVKLPVPMASLDKLKNVEELLSWVKRVGENHWFIITPKYDGISSCVTVKNGKPVQCLTRGDGEFGQDVTRHFQKVNPTNKFDFDGYFIGEEIIKKQIFSVKYSDKFSNPRNMVAGLFNKNEPSYQLGDVDFVPYTYIPFIETKSDKSWQMSIMGFEPDYKRGFSVVGEEITEDLLNKLFQEFSIDYEIDGLVIDVNSSDLRQELGYETNENPAFSKAIKLESWQQTKEAKVVGIELNVSKQGLVKPVIKIEPVQLSGVIIERITGYNYRYICENFIHPGSLILITRSGDVIPKHLSTVNFNKLLFKEFISKKYAECPSCGSKLELNEVEAICVNPNCCGKLISNLISFFEILEIEEMGESTVKKLIDCGYDNPIKILTLTVNEISVIGGFGNTSGLRLVSQFKNLMDNGVNLSKLLHSIGIFEGLGEKKLDNIISYLPQEPENIFDFCNTIFNKVSIDMLLSIPGVSNKTVSSLINGIEKVAENNQFIQLLSDIIPIRKKFRPVEGFLSGKTFCFTGFRDKEKAKFIEDNGGIYSNSLKTTTQYLVVKDINSTSSKIQTAKKRGVNVISIDELNLMLNIS